MLEKNSFGNWVTLIKQLNTVVSEYDQSFYRLVCHFLKIKLTLKLGNDFSLPKLKSKQEKL